MYKAHKTGRVLFRGKVETAYEVFWFDDRVPLVDRVTYPDTRDNFPLWEARQVAEAMNANAYGVGVYGA